MWKVVYSVKGSINLTDLITQNLREYTDDVIEQIDKSAEKLAKESAMRLKAKSPKRTGAYAKSWRASKVNGKWIVHNVKHYRLTHLLENGHALVNGGRSAAQPHIKPVEEEVVAEFLKDVEEAIKR